MRYALLLLLLFPTYSPAQCATCPQVAAPAYGWVSGNGWLYLYRGSEYVGAYDTQRQLYFSSAGQPAQLPCRLPAAYESRRPNYGLDLEHIPEAGERAMYLLGDERVSQEVARRVIREGGIPGYRDRPALVVIGTDAERAVVDRDFQADGMREFRQRVNYWSVPPDHWSVKNQNGQPLYVLDGHPTIYLIAPSGSVLHRQTGYAGVADLQRLAGSAPAAPQARRDNDGRYDPRRDPDLRRAVLPTLPIAMIAAALSTLGFLYWRRK